MKSVVDGAVVVTRAEDEDPSTWMIPPDNDIRDDGEENVSGDSEDNVSGDGEDDNVIDCAVPSFDPMENRL